MGKKQEITKAETEKLVQQKVKNYYTSMKKHGYHLKPILEDNAEEHLHNFFFEDVKEKYIIMG